MRGFLYFCCTLIIACSAKQNDGSVPSSKLTEAVTSTMNTYHHALLDKNAPELLNTLAEDGIFLGTDPNEHFTKQQLADYLKGPFADTTQLTPYTVVREVRPAEDQHSALVIEQYVFREISPVIPVRAIGHLVLQDGQWLIDFYSLSLVPRNKDLANINQFLE